MDKYEYALRVWAALEATPGNPLDGEDLGQLIHITLGEEFNALEVCWDDESIALYQRYVKHYQA